MSVRKLALLCACSIGILDHPIFKPKSVLNKEIVEDFAKDFMYFDCIRYINMVHT